MSEHAAIPPGSLPGHSVLPRRLGFDFQASGYPIRPAHPNERNADLGGGTPDRGPGYRSNRRMENGGNHHPYRWGAFILSAPAAVIILGYAIWHAVGGG